MSDPTFCVPFTQEDVNVVLGVTLKTVITAGLYSGPLDKDTVADLLLDYLTNVSSADLADLIDVQIVSLHTDEGTELLPCLGKEE